MSMDLAHGITMLSWSDDVGLVRATLPPTDTEIQ